MSALTVGGDDMPRTAAQNEAIRDKRKDKIINKTLKLFATKGFDSITIDDISKVSNCAHGLFYHYWEVKEDLYNSVVAQYEIKYANKLLDQDELNNVSGIDAIRMITNFYGRIMKESDYLVCFSRLYLNKSYQCRTAIKALNGLDLGKLLPQIIKKGQEEGTIKNGDPKDLSKLLIAIFLAETELRLSLGEEYKPLDSGFILEQLAA